MLFWRFSFKYDTEIGNYISNPPEVGEESYVDCILAGFDENIGSSTYSSRRKKRVIKKMELL